MKTSAKEIILYTIHDDHRSQQTLAYATAENLPIQEFDITKEQLPQTRFFELAELLGTTVEDLIDKDGPEYMDLDVKNKEKFDEEDWAKLIQKNPGIMHTPIAIKGNKAKKIGTPTEILYL